VGRRRQAESTGNAFLQRLARLETLGLALMLLGAGAASWCVLGANPPGPLRDVVRSLGVNVFTVAAVVVAGGWLIWRRQVALLLAKPRVVAIAPLFILATAGPLGLFEPSSSLGGVSLAQTSAGGDLGRLFTGSAAGVLAWLAAASAFAVTASPAGARWTLRQAPVVARTVWRWHIPSKLLGATATFVDFAFPTKPPLDEQPSLAKPAWLPDDSGREPEAHVAAVEAPADLSGPLKQQELPIAWQDDEDREPAPLAKSAAGWKMPAIDMLAAAAPADETAKPDNAARSALIVQTLASFGVDARVVQVNEGPVVTQFGIEPGWEVKYRNIPERDKDGRPLLDKDGRPRVHQEEVSRTRVRVNQITTLQNDLALALAAPAIRIEAPVPGKSVIGIEVPNTAASVVTLRSVMETAAFQRLAQRSKLALALGKSVAGEPVVADLARAPHLLIAGATGSGKSVCMNTIISCLLMQAKPEEVRFVMIDPKRVELAGFAMIPHLAFSSIVVDVEKVVGTLGAVLHEMEDRYKRFAALAVRNIEGYNKHPKVSERMPYWVVIIDELADLMMAAPFEVERQICRLAQLARATGIHLIVATQRPSVDVVTGLIKANFPTRIAFAMTSQVDSRTILDSAGAERLLGRGDMLYMPTDSTKPKRVQGVYVSDPEIDRIVGFWAEQRLKGGNSTPVYDHLLEEAQAQIEEDEDDDPMYERARSLAQEHSRISTSMLQRRLRIGYPRAARLMDVLEEEGIVAPSSGGGSREVIAVTGYGDESDGRDRPGDD
jgi:S-DNA-T family DNA segregation ATPase FtsK/SpoIIIE